MTIHSDDPFAVPIDQRDPARRLRGRLVSPVTILTADNDDPTGVTVSSVLVVEGEPARLVAVLGTGNDLTKAARRTGTFAFHILDVDQFGIAEVFAGYRPAPGGPFAVTDWQAGEWGPVLTDVSDRGGCRLEQVEPLGDQELVIGTLEHIEVTDLTDPLTHFRGRFGRTG